MKMRRYYGFQTNKDLEFPQELFWFKSKGERDDWVAAGRPWHRLASVRDARSFIIGRVHEYGNELENEGVPVSYWSMDELVDWYEDCREYIINKFTREFYGV